MFNLIMRWFEWGHDNAGTIPLGRMFEYTEDHLIEQFRVEGVPQLDRLARLPCLFMNEGVDDQVCRVGTITRVRIVNREVAFEYASTEERRVGKGGVSTCRSGWARYR